MRVSFTTPSKAWHCTKAIFSIGEGKLYRASKTAELEYRATASEDGLHYEVKFPDSYFQGGCEYRAELVAIMLEEDNTQDPQWLKGTWMRKTKIRTGEAGWFGLGKPGDDNYTLPDDYLINPSYVLCRPLNQNSNTGWSEPEDIVRDAQGNPEKWIKKMKCQPQDFYGKFGVGLTPAYLKTIKGRFTLNILVEQETYCSRCTPEELQETGWPLFDHDDQTAIAHRAVFEAFEQANGLKGAQ